MAHAKEYARILEAYIKMAEQARYRPAANTVLTSEELGDREILKEEAARYAEKFLAQENTAQFWIGVSDFSTNRALVYVIEAARCLCAAQSLLRHEIATRLLALAAEDLAARSKDKDQ
jgi:hypothetical protein